MSAGHLLTVLVAAKVATLWGRPITWSLSTPIAYLWQDVLIALVFAAASAVFPRGRLRAPTRAILYWLLVVYTALNIPIALVLSTPLTWPMVRATSGTLADSILLYATWRNVALIVATLAVAALLPRIQLRHTRKKPATTLAVIAALIVVVLGPIALARVDSMGLHRNPVVALVATALPRVTAKTSAGDWTTPIDEHDTDDYSALRGLAAGRNVILVSLESTGAQYLRLYGGAHDITPHLDRLAQHALVFDNAYAVYPESIKGLFSVLCSTYPAFDTSPDVYETAPCQSIAQSLARQQYRSALFHSGRFGYLGMQSIVRNRGFDTLEDAGDIGGKHESSFGVDEPATVARILSWIDALPDEAPFFINYLPIAGHHPYDTPEPGPLPTRAEIDRYRNALHYGDRALGALMAGIRARGLEERTVWIVIGDHGEALGQHEGNYGHTFFLYEENVRVPFLVAIPGALQRQQRSRTTVSLVDTAPTILDLLGLPIPPQYQGHTALDGRARMALFFTDYSLGLLGLRDGRWKFVYELDSGRSKLFDLDADPGETTDQAAVYATRVAAYRQTLRDWSANQKSYVTGVRGDRRASS